MSLNLSPGIEWTTYTWNPIVGCLNGCPYCYARQVAKRLSCEKCQAFEPHFHPERLKSINHQKSRPGIVFLESMGDLFGEGVDPAWVRQVLVAIADSRVGHKIVTLTKRPDRICEIIDATGLSMIDVISLGIWIGVSISDQYDLNESRTGEGRLIDLSENWEGKSFVSIEPLLGPIDIRRHLSIGDWDCVRCGWRGDNTADQCWECGESGFFPNNEDGTYGVCPECGSENLEVACPVCMESSPVGESEFNGLDWIIIGGLSGPIEKVYPCIFTSRKENRRCLLEDQAIWANEIIKETQKYKDRPWLRKTPVFVKTKPVRIPGVPVIQEWPEDLTNGLR